MQNVTLPDKDEVEAQPTGLEFPGVHGDVQPFFEDMGHLVMELERFVRALYAKHGEECPLFKEGDDGQNG